MYFWVNLDLENNVIKYIHRSLHEEHERYCEEKYGRKWTVYSDQHMARLLEKNKGSPNCTFEAGLCNWSDDWPGSDIPWTRHQGSTQSFNTGPRHDHTYQAEHSRGGIFKSIQK